MAVKKETKKGKRLFYFAVVLLIVSLGVFSMNVGKFLKLTGFGVTELGTVNLTIESTINVNFTTDNINWGSGSVNADASYATLNTTGGANNVTNGNWTGNTAGLILENIGNENVTLNLLAGKSAATFIGGTNPDYEWNVTSNETGSCLNVTGGTQTMGGSFNLSYFFNVNTTSPGTLVCDSFNYSSSADELRVDIRIVIPNDAPAGAKGDILTVTATAI